MKNLSYYQSMVDDDNLDFAPHSEPSTAYYCEKTIGHHPHTDTYLFKITPKEATTFNINTTDFPYFCLYYAPDGFIYGAELTPAEYADWKERISL